MDNKQIADKYLKWVNDNYEYLKNKYQAFCNNKKYSYDEDIFSDTYVKIYNKILKDGIEDCTDKGFENYQFKAFKQNLQREAQYSRNKQRDGNVTNISGAYEIFYNEHYSSTKEKLMSDLFKDFSTLYILEKVEDNFNGEHLYLFRIKYLNNLTYKELSDKTGIKGARQKVIEVKNWLKENVSKTEIKKAFEQTYGNIFFE